MRVPLAAEATAQPFYLQTRGGTVLCWWHPPTSAAVAYPVLLCPTWGDEEIGAYGGWRALALGLAQQGVPVLRLDLPGEGDSLERPQGLAGWSAWLDALEDAALALCQVTTSPRIHLLGLRLGALLAAQLADRLRQQGLRVASLLLLAPVASGRAFVREARLLNAVSVEETLSEGELQVGGFVLDAQSAQAMVAAPWPSAAPQPQGLGCPVCIWERRDRPLPEATKAALQTWAGEAGLVCTARDDLTGLTAVAHSAVWPELTAPLLEWLGRAGLAAGVGVGGWPAACAMAAGPGWTEELVGLGSGLVAQCTRPKGRIQGQATCATVFLSSGAERRIGPHRLWVRYARARAASGDLCLRLDLAGIGDSMARGAAEPLNPADVIYDARAMDDVRTALRWLAQAQGVTQVRLVGLCSGAYHAWRCAVAGLPLAQVVAINPLVYHWRAGLSLDPSHHAFGQIDIANSALRSLKDPVRWLKLLQGQVHVKVILRAVGARFISGAQNVARQVGRRLHWPLSEDVVNDLRQVIRHGTPLTFVFSKGDPGQTLLRQQAGGYLPPILAQTCVDFTTIEGADHTFSTRSGRDRLYNCLNSILGSVNDSSVTDEDQNLASVTPLQS